MGKMRCKYCNRVLKKDRVYVRKIFNPSSVICLRCEEKRQPDTFTGDNFIGIETDPIKMSEKNIVYWENNPVICENCSIATNLIVDTAFVGTIYETKICLCTECYYVTILECYM